MDESGDMGVSLASVVGREGWSRHSLVVLRQLLGRYVDVGRLAMALPRNSQPLLGTSQPRGQFGRVGSIVICVVEQLQPRIEDDLSGVHDGRACFQVQSRYL